LALSPEEKYIILAICAVLGIFIIYFEVRFMRGKSKEVRHAAQRKDEAYNAVLTTRSVMNVMQSRGADTKSAETMVASARLAMQRGDYDGCMNFCERARKELTNPSKPAPAPTSAADRSDLERVAESILGSNNGPSGSDLYSGSKLAVDRDGNYLSAKFEINAAKSDLKEAVDGGGDSSDAQGLLTDAEGAFVAGNYTKALSLALRARKAISSEVAIETIPLKRVEGEDTETEPMPDESSGPTAQRCKKCSTLLEPGDTFCGVCGAKVLVERICENCGAKSRANDKFCRKCGASL
jgi:RNA polymerase subunit RPABC4/transcription elongation factor Spt4